MGRWIEVADQVWVRRHTELDLSLGLVVGERACLVVDTGADERQGAGFAAAVRELTGLPWSVVLTHAHFDHAFGTAAFAGAAVWAHPGCRAELAGGAREQRTTWAAYYRAKGDPEAAARIEAARIVPPDRPVEDTAEIDLGGRVVRLLHPGPGHTGHDLVAHVPDAAVLFAGDLVEQGAPPSFDDSRPAAWPAAVDRLLDLGARTVVPGHGEPVDAAFVTRQRHQLAEVAALCRAVAAGEMTADDALARSPYPAEFTTEALRRAAASA
ncbi:MBL fold metallo-hydrolase [Sphaerisporangium krabiense]|uniref:Glyoxylase-like metal-dependent hydrolase (Beta-lactamase superfamily II) n=1 Tax=Sphaerisporangium krabiense TaxID=763782 RepID=A0A7W9DSS8_9ACTN|nr:MBL fold metallo-hydrolase [Sphaerisporangium krabiense]MBB5630052.1 glyoxylase-like metal-dependent hydrolase (beta-lactamase superfamily II) [Sphaerisporangium krabiense]GII65000.1 MBL fold metallo-hydrolase [Sphaerisporangium krabiense]